MLGASEFEHLVAARRGDSRAFSNLTEPYRRELLAHCYRMLGSLQEAEDLVQETLLRAWRRLDTFERDISFRAWLYKIATNACLNTLVKRSLRILPPGKFPPADAHSPIAPPNTEILWLEPFPDEWLPQGTTDPEARYSVQESIRLAFLVALQLLPPHQRAVLILCDVLDWRASEAAELLELTIPAVNSALHRARTTLAEQQSAGEYETAQARMEYEVTRPLLGQYVRAMEEADVPGLVALVKEDARFTMPPLPGWYQGRASIGTFFALALFAGDAAGRWKLHPARANAQPAFGLYQRDPASGRYQPYALQVLTLLEPGGAIAEIVNFLDPNLFARFGLPAELSA